MEELQNKNNVRKIEERKDDLSQKVARKLYIPAVPKKLFAIERVDNPTPTPISYFSPSLKTEATHVYHNLNEQPKKLLGSKRRLFETSYDPQQDSCPSSKRFKPNNDTDEAIDSSSFRCLETLVKLILSSERAQTHQEDQINILTELGHQLLSSDNSMLLQHSSLLSHVGFLAQQKQVSNELILRDLRCKYAM